SRPVSPRASSERSTCEARSSQQGSPSNGCRCMTRSAVRTRSGGSRRRLTPGPSSARLAVTPSSAHHLVMQVASRALPRTDVLLEREDALAAVHEAHSETKAGSGRLVLISGEAGVGKTVLTRAFCDSVRRSTRVVEGACDALATPRPLGPF